ncbi:tetraspanin-8-like [Diospyros lotus]|uniref:tetraspanin-8-like n=1 Tax=Diospyros lotus TaxID=55363 RepID=UPI002251B256|nr:tetraspanin-8-like [Diospyros lotus]
MVRLSNSIVVLVNVLTLVISVAVIGGAAWSYTHPGSLCHRVLQQPLLFLGLSLLAVSLLGLIGACCRVQFLLWIYLFVMFVLIVGLVCFTVFTVVVTNKGVGKAVSDKGYKEYRLGDYSNWLRKYVVNQENWAKIRSCLVVADVCSTLGANPNETLADFRKRTLSPIQSGCCKPPTSCGFKFKNATYWTAPKTGGPAAADGDCATWSNNQSVLCYGCQSCKAGVLANIKKEWKLLAIINVVVLVFVIIIYSIGCCALRNVRSSGYLQSGKGHP